jgi:TonB-linked SusC/RagA family outer membrane protein
MKFTLILVIAGTFCLYANTGYAQDTRIRIHLENASLTDVFREIEKQSDYRFFYNTAVISPGMKFDLNADNESVSALLNDLFQGTDINYRMVENYIVITSKDDSMGELLSKAMQQNIVVVGTVTDEADEPMPGVNVVIKGTTAGVITGADGRYHITVPNRNAVLVFSFMGYTTQEITVGDRTNVSIILEEDAKEIEEVIVIGYGTAKRQEFTGSVGSVKMENSVLALLPNMNALESLKGTVTGMNIGAVNSAGAEPSMLIRGQNSINGSNNPLIVLDGVIYMGSVSDINPNDIASIDVLKDAVSSAVYGSRSANGVIAITTKKGRSEKPLITLNASAGIQSWPNRPELMNGEEFVKLVNLRANYPEGTTVWMHANELANYQAGRELVWLDEITRTGTVQDYQLAVSGAGKGINYYLSTSYSNNKNIMKGNQYEHVSVFGKINTDITGWLNIGADASYSRRDHSGVGADLYSAKILTPYGVLYRDDEGNLERYPYTESAPNPLWGVVDDGTRDHMNIQDNFRLNAYAVVSLPWIKGLSYRIHFLPNLAKNHTGNFYHESYYIAQGEGLDRYSPTALQGLLSQANGSVSNSQSYSYVYDNILTYKNAFGKHGVEGTLVATRDYAKNVKENMTGSNFSDNGNSTLGMWALHKATVQKIDQNNGWKRTNIGYLGRVSYAYDGKYYFTGSVRKDGASVFGSNRKWGTFAAAGVAWRIAEENFMKRIEPLDDLKLKFSWGQNGNQGISPYATLSQVVNGSTSGYRYEFSNTGATIFYGMNQSTLGNEDLGWEKTNAWNTGFESVWLKNRLHVDLDVYYSQTIDQIFNRNIPIMTGFKTITTSMGRVDNKGMELNIRSINIEKQDWTWSTNVTFWLNRNKLVKLYGELDENGKEKDDIGSSLFINKSLGTIYGYKQTGIVQEDETDYTAETGIRPGMPKYATDLDGKPGLSPDDRTILGCTKENFRLNIANTVSYKGFELYLLITGIFGGNNYYLSNNQSAYTMATVIPYNNMVSKPYWTPENRSNKYPAVNFVDDGGRFRGLQSRGFVRLQDITFSYTFNFAWMKSANIHLLKLFFAAKNVAYFTKWDGGDPETGETYLSGTYPVVSTYSVGLNISL